MQDFQEQIDDSKKREYFEATMKLPFCFLANSNFTKELILRLQPKAQVHVTNVGVDTKVFYPRGHDRVADVKRTKIMAIIKEGYFKGGDIAIDVLNHVNRDIPIHALLVGSSLTIDELRANIRIDFPYTIYETLKDSELASLYSSADLFLFTSRAEGFGLPPLEAMACGTAVVTTNCKGNMDYAVSDYNSLVALPDEIQRLADYTIKIVKNEALRNRLVEGGIETARKFSWERTVDEFERAFKTEIK